MCDVSDLFPDASQEGSVTVEARDVVSEDISTIDDLELVLQDKYPILFDLLEQAKNGTLAAENFSPATLIDLLKHLNRTYNDSVIAIYMDAFKLAIAKLTDFQEMYRKYSEYYQQLHAAQQIGAEFLRRLMPLTYTNIREQLEGGA